MSKRRLIIGLVALVVVAVALVVVGKTMGQKDEFTLVETTKVVKAPFEVVVTASGNVEAEETEEVHSTVTGRIAQVAVEEGDLVRAGETAVLLDDSDLAASYQQAKAGLAGAQADLAQAKGSTVVKTLDDDLEVKQATAQVASAEARLVEVKKGATEAQLAQARSTLSQAEVALADARSEQERNKRLLAAGAIPRRQLEDSVNRARTAEAAYQAAQKAYDDLKAGPTTEQVRVAQAAVDQARAGLGLAKERATTKDDRIRAAQARVAQAQASLKAVEEQFRGARIVSPVAGTVIAKLVTDGQFVTSGQPVVKVADLRRVLVKAKVEEADIDRVKVGQTVTVTADAAIGVKLAGKVTKIAPQAIVDSGVMKFLVDVETHNKGGILRPGMTADCDFSTYRNASALAIPLQAVVERPVKEPAKPTPGAVEPVLAVAGEKTVKVVYAVRDGVAKRVQVELGNLGLADVEVLSGLASGDVIITGDYKALKTLRDGDKVKTADSGAVVKK